MKPAASATPLNRTAPASPAGIHEIEEEASAHASPSHSPAQSEGALTMLAPPEQARKGDRRRHGVCSAVGQPLAIG